MQRNPCSTEELIEPIICLAKPVDQAAANYMDAEFLVELGCAECHIFDVFHLLELWERDTGGKVGIS